MKGSYGTKVGACPCWPLLLLLLLLLLWGGVGVRLPGCLQGTGRRKSTFRQGNGLRVQRRGAAKIETKGREGTCMGRVLESEAK